MDTLLSVGPHLKKSEISGKVSDDIEDPISVMMYKIDDLLGPFLYRMGITPNMITTLRVLVFLYVFQLISQNRLKQAGFSYLFYYFLDTLDGHYARKYDMVTEFGDYYDHVVDNVALPIIVYYIYINLHNKNYIYLILFLILLSVTHVGCEELYLSKYGNNQIESNSLHIVKSLCPVDKLNQIETFMQLIRYFGCGTLHLVIAIFISYIGVL